MEFVELESSCLAEVGYDRESEVMVLEFVSGGQVELSGVPPEHFQGLLETDSPGRYWHSHLKGRY